MKFGHEFIKSHIKEGSTISNDPVMMVKVLKCAKDMLYFVGVISDGQG